MNKTDDETIISMMKDPFLRDKGFLLLMDKYKQPIYWHIRRLVVSHEDAEDILQETFIQVYRFVSSFKGDSVIYTWIYRIATNECIRHFRKNNHNDKNESYILEEIPDVQSETDTDSSDTILLKFQKAILLLPERQRIVFNLRYFDELSYEDIGKVLNSSVNSLKTNYHFASERIKQYLIDNA